MAWTHSKLWEISSLTMNQIIFHLLLLILIEWWTNSTLFILLCSKDSKNIEEKDSDQLKTIMSKKSSNSPCIRVSLRDDDQRTHWRARQKGYCSNRKSIILEGVSLFQVRHLCSFRSRWGPLDWFWNKIDLYFGLFRESI